MAALSPGAPRPHDPDPARGDPRGRLRPARLPRRRAAADAGRRRPRLLRPLQGALHGRQLRRTRPSTTPATGHPGAPLLYAASFYATAGAREGTARIVEAAARPRRDRRRLPARQADQLPAGRAVRSLRRRRLPAVHPLDRRPIQRAAGDLHSCPRRCWHSSGHRMRYQPYRRAGPVAGEGGTAGGPRSVLDPPPPATRARDG